MPVRRIGLCYRSVGGRVPMGPNRPAVAVESTLERDFALLQRFDPDVALVEEQPVRIDFADGTYVPDFLVTYRRGDRPAWLVEVKYSTDPALVAGALEARFTAARAYARHHGWVFSVATEQDIRTPRLANATFLLPFRARNLAPDLRSSLFDAIGRCRSGTVEAAVNVAAQSLGIGQDRVLPNLWSMVARFEIAADLDRPLTMRSPLSLPEGDGV